MMTGYGDVSIGIRSSWKTQKLKHKNTNKRIAEENKIFWSDTFWNSLYESSVLPGINNRLKIKPTASTSIKQMTLSVYTFFITYTKVVECYLWVNSEDGTTKKAMT